MRDMATILAELPQVCAAGHPTDAAFILLHRGRKGYSMLYSIKTQAQADAFNAERQVTPAQLEAMICGSMFGFECPAADPANYDHLGNFKRGGGMTAIAKLRQAPEIQAFDARSYPTPMGEEIGTMIVLTVLVSRIEGTIKAYSAIVPDTSRDDPQYRGPAQWVRKNGAPLRFSEARAIWPGLEEQEYAR